MTHEFIDQRDYAEFLTSLPELEDNSHSTVADPLNEYLKWSARITSTEVQFRHIGLEGFDRQP